MLYQKYMTSRGVDPAYRKRLKLRDVKGGFRIPYFDADGKVMFEQKRNVPPIEINGRTAKFTFPKGTLGNFNHLPLTGDRQWRRDVYSNPAVDIMYAESVSKGAVLAQLGYAALTTGSVQGHRTQKTASGYIPGLDAIPWGGRTVGVIWDNDIYDNTNVQDALFNFSRQVINRGARVQVWLLPRPEWDDVKGEFIKIGLDDFVAQQGPKAAEAIRALPRVGLDDPLLATWGRKEKPPKPSVVESLQFAPRPLSVLKNTPPERRYVLMPWIGVGQLAFLAMAGGAGKGFLSLSLAVHIAAGRQWFGMPVTSGRVVLLCLEDSAEELDRRLHYVVQHYCQRYQLDTSARRELFAKVIDNVRYESVEGRQLHIIEEYNRNIVQTPDLHNLAQKLAKLQPVLIVVDPLSQLHSLNENDNSVGSAIVSAVGHIRNVTGSAILVPAHVSKAADDRGTKTANAMRGASSFATSARSVVHGDVLDAKEAAKIFAVEEYEAKDRFAIFTHVKNNYGPKMKPVFMVRNDQGVWTPHDEAVIPFRDKASDGEAWLKELQRWVKTLEHPSFSKRDITQNDETRQAAFGNGCSRKAAEASLEKALADGSVRKLSRAEREELPATMRRGGGTRFCLANKVSK